MAVTGVRSYGAEALLVEVDATTAVGGVRRNAEGLAGVLETMPGLQTVLVRFDPAVVSASALAARVREAVDDDGLEDDDEVPDPVTVHVDYDGPDLDDVAAHTGLAAADVVAAHTAATYRVALIGMAPGFYFLAGGDDRLQVPRRRSPRERVPRGSVGLAGAYTGIYPKDGPGGWQLVGRVRDDLWHTDRYPAARLAPGTVVRLVAA
jgi:KipI family sensor histidine kinase inhibitor